MSEWKKNSLGAVIQLIGGGTPKTSVPEYWNGDIPWLSVVDFNHGRKYVSKTEKSITQKGLENSSTKYLRKGDLIISARGTVGALAVLSKDMTFNQSCYGVKGISNITLTEYVYYLLKNTVRELSQISHGGVFDTITRATFDDIEINLPPLPAQKAIADILSALDDKIDLLHRQNHTLEQMAETLFRQWFVEEIQEDWEEVELGEVIETTSGGTPSRKNMEFYENGVFDWVKSKELNGLFITHTEEKITEEALKKSSAKLLPAYSVLVAMYGVTVGEFSLITKEMTCNQAICAIKENKNYPYPFIFSYIKFNKENLINRAVGSAQQNISQLLIKQMKIPNCISRIQEFSEITLPIFKKIEFNTKQIQTLETLRDTLLPKLISGEVRVNVQVA